MAAELGGALAPTPSSCRRPHWRQRAFLTPDDDRRRSVQLDCFPSLLQLFRCGIMNGRESRPAEADIFFMTGRDERIEAAPGGFEVYDDACSVWDVRDFVT